MAPDQSETTRVILIPPPLTRGKVWAVPVATSTSVNRFGNSRSRKSRKASFGLVDKAALAGTVLGASSGPWRPTPPPRCSFSLPGAKLLFARSLSGAADRLCGSRSCSSCTRWRWRSSYSALRSPASPRKRGVHELAEVVSSLSARGRADIRGGYCRGPMRDGSLSCRPTLRLHETAGPPCHAMVITTPAPITISASPANNMGSRVLSLGPLRLASKSLRRSPRSASIVSSFQVLGVKLRPRNR